MLSIKLTSLLAKHCTCMYWSFIFVFLFLCCLFFSTLFCFPSKHYRSLVFVFVFIGPKSEHWLCLSLTHLLTHWLTHSLPFSKLRWCEPGMWRWQLKTCWSCYCCWCWWLGPCWQQFVADLEAEVGSKRKSLTFVQTFSTRFGQEFEVEVQARFWSWTLVSILLLILVEVTQLNLGQDHEAKFG